MKKQLIIASFILIILTLSVSALIPIGSIFDPITEEISDDSRSYIVGKPTYDGQLPNDFSLVIAGHDSTATEGTPYHIRVLVSNNGLVSGGMNVECGILDRADNSWLPRSWGLPAAEDKYMSNCIAGENNMQTARVTLDNKGSTGDHIYVDFTIVVPEADDPTIYCNAFEQCSTDGSTFSSDVVTEDITIQEQYMTCEAECTGIGIQQCVNGQNAYQICIADPSYPNTDCYIWDNGHTCASGSSCKDGECCEAHDYKKCYGGTDGDVYWYDSCGNREEIYDSCDSDQYCSNGKCIDQAVPCPPSCTGKECGDNGCGSSCGTCGSGEECQNGICVAEGTTPVSTDVIVPIELIYDKTKQYVPGDDVDFSVELSTDSVTDETAYIEVAMYCGDLLDYLHLTDYTGNSYSSWVGRSYSVENIDKPCVESESSFVQRKRVTMKKADGIKTVTGFQLTVPEEGVMGGASGDISNTPTESTPFCYVSVDVFDRCYSESGQSTSTDYIGPQTVLIELFEDYDTDNKVCCLRAETEKLEFSSPEDCGNYLSSQADLSREFNLFGFDGTLIGWVGGIIKDYATRTYDDWFNKDEIMPYDDCEYKDVKAYESGNDWCIVTFGVVDTCYTKKTPIPLSELKNLDQLTGIEKTTQSFLEDPDVPICLNEYGDVQCEDDAECLPAIDSTRSDKEDNKIVFDYLSDVVITRQDKFNGVTDTLKLLLDPCSIESLTQVSINFQLWLNDESSTELDIEQYGICVYEDRSILGTASRWIAETFGLDPDSEYVKYILWGGMALIVVLVIFLLKPPTPRVYH